MKAAILERYGDLEVLEVREIEDPVPRDDEVLVSVHASSITTQNLVLIRGRPLFVRPAAFGLTRPKFRIPGNDIAGRVKAVGASVENFRPGDDVFGDLAPYGYGAYAEFVCVPEKAIAPGPSNMDFVAAAGAPEAGLVALQGLRDRGRIRSGQKVLVFGASGGIGTFAVQLARHFGAEVTGVCGTRNLDVVRSLGADHVIDYTKEDYTRSGARYDLIFAIATRPIAEHKRALAPGGVYVSVGSPSLSRIFDDMVWGPRTVGKSRRVEGGWSAQPNQKDLILLKDLIEAGHVRTVIDSRHPLDEVVEALRYYGRGHSRGKVILTMPRSDQP